MNNPEIQLEAPKERAITMPTVIKLNILLFFLSLGAVYGAWRISLSPEAKSVNARQELEARELSLDIGKRKAEFEARLTVARARQTELLATVKQTTGSLLEAIACIRHADPRYF